MLVVECDVEIIVVRNLECVWISFVNCCELFI